MGEGNRPVKKKILLISTGGTIASQKTSMGLTPGIPSQRLLEWIPEVKDLCDVDTTQILNLDSTNMQPEDWLLMVRAIRDAYDRYDGFVITHGTDTMAYTAAALSYLIQNSQKPIVITGSQRPMEVGTTDGPQNLLDSFVFCIQPDVRGVYLVFDGKAIVGTRVRKVKTRSYSAFESINFPVVALINDWRIIRYLNPCQQGERPVQFYDNIHPGVFLLKLIPGMEPDILDYVAQRYDAVIIESYGSGGLPFTDERNFLQKVSELASKDKIIVMATQVMLEGSDLTAYEVGAIARQKVPLLEAYDMTVEAAVAKLMWILTQTREFAQVKEMFYTPVNFDLCWPMPQ